MKFLFDQSTPVVEFGVVWDESRIDSANWSPTNGSGIQLSCLDAVLRFCVPTDGGQKIGRKRRRTVERQQVRDYHFGPSRIGSHSRRNGRFSTTGRGPSANGIVFSNSRHGSVNDFSDQTISASTSSDGESASFLRSRCRRHRAVPRYPQSRVDESSNELIEPTRGGDCQEHPERSTHGKKQNAKMRNLGHPLPLHWTTSRRVTAKERGSAITLARFSLNVITSQANRHQHRPKIPSAAHETAGSLLPTPPTSRLGVPPPIARGYLFAPPGIA